MSKFTDCWGKLDAKAHKHRDGTRVLTAADKRAILSDIDERIRSGDSPLEAAKAAVGAQLAQVRGQMADVYRQAGVSFSRPLTPEADAEHAAAEARGDVATGQRMVDEAARAAGAKGVYYKAMPDTDWRNGNPINVINSTNGPWAGFFTDSKPAADKFGRIMRVPTRSAYLWFESPYTVDATKKAAGELQFDMRPTQERYTQKNNQEILDAISSGTYDAIVLSNTVDEGTVVVPLKSNQIKSADPFTYDDQGKLIPLSQRFNPQSEDIRYSVPLDEPPPADEPRPTSQVFGEAGTTEVTPASKARVQPIIRQQFFDSTQPITPEQTQKALDYVTRSMGRATGPALANEVRAAVPDTDTNIAVGVFQRELYEYSVRLLSKGSPRLYDLIQRHGSTNFIIGLDSEGNPITFRSIAQELYGRSRLAHSGSEHARHLVNIDMVEAAGKHLGQEGLDAIGEAVDQTSLTPPEVTSVGETPVGQETFRGRVKRLTRKTPAADNPFEALDKEMSEAPLHLQQDPQWRRDTIMRHVGQMGLSDKTAAATARAYEQQFVDRLKKKIETRLKQVLNSKAPWVAKTKKMKGGAKKKLERNVARILAAVKGGLTDPNNDWMRELATENGWKGFTAEQHARLEEIEQKLMDPDILPSDRAKYLHETNTIITEAKLPPTVANVVLASYVASALSGISTLMVQPSAHVGGVVKAIFNAVADPLSAATHLKLMGQATKTVALETKFAARTGIYRNEILESLKGFEKPLEQTLKGGLKDLQSPNALTRAKGLGKVVVGSQEYVMRALSAFDQGYITTAKEYSAALFTRDILRQLGMTRAEADAVVEEAMRAKDDIYQELLSLGEKPDQAAANATDIYLKKLYETVSKQPGEYEGLSGADLADEIMRAADLESEGQTGRVSRGVGMLGEGVLSIPANYLLKGISESQNKGGLTALYMRALFGFIAIPLRTARWYAGYSPYGFVRYTIHKTAQRLGKDSPYQQSYGSQLQERQRLREAIGGTVVTALLLALATPSGDDDEDKPNALFVTGKGPRDPVLREAWLKRFKPYGITLKVNGVYTTVPYGRIAESIGWAASAAGTMDDLNLTKKTKEARGTEVDNVGEVLLGNTIGNLTERSSFKGLWKMGELATQSSQQGAASKTAGQAAFITSSLIPWKSAMNSFQRMVADPVDNETIQGSLVASIPVLGPLTGKTRLNALGDPAGDLSYAGRSFSMGVPLPVKIDPKDQKAYDLILHHGRGPSAVRRNDFAKMYETDDKDAAFYEFGKRRGHRITKALVDNYDRLMTVDAETFGKFLERLAISVNQSTAAEMKLKRTAK